MDLSFSVDNRTGELLMIEWMEFSGAILFPYRILFIIQNIPSERRLRPPEGKFDFCFPYNKDPSSSSPLNYLRRIHAPKPDGGGHTPIDRGSFSRPYYGRSS
jgi:hypothetical protein